MERRERFFFNVLVKAELQSSREIRPKAVSASDIAGSPLILTANATRPHPSILVSLVEFFKELSLVIFWAPSQELLDPFYVIVHHFMLYT